MLLQLQISAGNGRKGDALLHWELLLHSSSLWQAVPEGLGATRWSSAGRALVGNPHVSCCRAGCLGIPLQQGRKVEKSLWSTKCCCCQSASMVLASCFLTRFNYFPTGGVAAALGLWMRVGFWEELAPVVVVVFIGRRCLHRGEASCGHRQLCPGSSRGWLAAVCRHYLYELGMVYVVLPPSSCTVLSV